jgi:aminopeptidase N
MKWWNDLFLNEGFASYIEFKGINAAHPTWEMVSLIFMINLGKSGYLKFDYRKINSPSTPCIRS